VCSGCALAAEPSAGRGRPCSRRPWRLRCATSDSAGGQELCTWGGCGRLACLHLGGFAAAVRPVVKRARRTAGFRRGADPCRWGLTLSGLLLYGLWQLGSDSTSELYMTELHPRLWSRVVTGHQLFGTRLVCLHTISARACSLLWSNGPLGSIAPCMQALPCMQGAPFCQVTRGRWCGDCMSTR